MRVLSKPDLHHKVKQQLTWSHLLLHIDTRTPVANSRGPRMISRYFSEYNPLLRDLFYLIVGKLNNICFAHVWCLTMLYLLRRRRRLHVALWGWWSLHDRLRWRRWRRWRMGVSSGRLVARWGRHRLTRSGHDVACLRRWVLGQDRRRSLIHRGRLRVLTGALPTQRHLAELGC